ncbi:MAG: hypothetical protein INR62_13690, partial [Rhodospirillales bacterium]|nr:hypothetical protein [Acetobacter sp.]
QQYHLTPVVEYKFQGFTASALLNYFPAVRDANSVSLDPTNGIGGYNADKSFGGGLAGFLAANPGATPADFGAATGAPRILPKIRDYYTINLLFSYEFGLNKPVDNAPAPAPAPKDGKGGGKEVVSHEEVKKMMGFHLLDGLKLSFGIDNVTNARPPLIGDSPDATNTDASIYDPYQRRYYFVVTKKF